jgi:hypothetical protein
MLRRLRGGLAKAYRRDGKGAGLGKTPRCAQERWRLSASAPFRCLESLSRHVEAGPVAAHLSRSGCQSVEEFYRALGNGEEGSSAAPSPLGECLRRGQGWLGGRLRHAGCSRAAGGQALTA